MKVNKENLERFEKKAKTIASILTVVSVDLFTAAAASAFIPKNAKKITKILMCVGGSILGTMVIDAAQKNVIGNLNDLFTVINEALTESKLVAEATEAEDA